MIYNISKTNINTKMFKIMPKNVEKMAHNYSINFYNKKRSKKQIKYLIYHYTGMKNDSLAIKKLTSFNSKVPSDPAKTLSVETKYATEIAINIKIFFIKTVYIISFIYLKI